MAPPNLHKDTCFHPSSQPIVVCLSSQATHPKRASQLPKKHPKCTERNERDKTITKTKPPRARAASKNHLLRTCKHPGWHPRHVPPGRVPCRLPRNSGAQAPPGWGTLQTLAPGNAYRCRNAQGFFPRWRWTGRTVVVFGHLMVREEKGI